MMNHIWCPYACVKVWQKIFRAGIFKLFDATDTQI